MCSDRCARTAAALRAGNGLQCSVPRNARSGDRQPPDPSRMAQTSHIAQLSAILRSAMPSHPRCRRKRCARIENSRRQRLKTVIAPPATVQLPLARLYAVLAHLLAEAEPAAARPWNGQEGE